MTIRRPEHPDYEVLAAAVRYADAHADEQVAVTDIIAEFADPQSALYVAQQRALRVALHLGITSSRQKAAFAALWLDGLFAGARLRDSRENKG